MILRTALNTFSFPDVPLKELLPHCRNVGVQGIGLYSGHAAGASAAQIRRSIERYRLSCVGYYIEALSFNRREDLVSQQLINRAKLLQKLGINCMVVMPTADWRQQTQWLAKLHNAVAIASSHLEPNLIFAFEAAHPMQRSIFALTSISDTLDIVTAAPSKRRLIFDVVNSGVAALRALTPRQLSLVHSIHVAGIDSIGPSGPIRTRLGDGTVGLHELIEFLTASAYDRWIEIELCNMRDSSKNWRTEIAEAVRAVQALLSYHQSAPFSQ